MIWVINTNTNICHIYHYQKKPAHLSLFKQLDHPENKLKASDYLTSDKPGHYQTNGSARGAFSPHTEAKEVEIDNFAREIAHELEKGRNEHQYTELILIASPHMSGLVLQHLNSQVKGLIINHIQKDFQNISDQELLRYLTAHTVYHDEKK